jgi:hypothetical protein
MANDPEIDAMARISTALADLDEDARRRVLEWSAKKYSVSLGTHATSGQPRQSGGQAEEPGGSAEYADFVDLFDAASPTNDVDRALVGGYWQQVGQGQTSFDSQSVNNALKDVGHGVGNITQALTSLQKKTPALVRQMNKSGRTRQARKTYKLTSSGMAEVKRMLATSGEVD